jgi:uncharacterized ubiquitin-like protein YukD
VEQKIVLDGNRTLNDYLIGDGDHLVMMLVIAEYP